MNRRAGTQSAALALQQRRFVRAYMAGKHAGNATAAALEAGVGRTPKSAASIASRMLRDPAVLALIERHLDRMDASTERVALELRRVAFATLRDVGTWDATGFTPTPADELDDHAAAAVKGVEVRESETENGVFRKVSVTLHDKVGALGLLARINKMLVERREHTGPNGGPIEYVDLTQLSLVELRAYRAIRARLDRVAPEPEDLAALRAIAAPAEGDRVVDVRAASPGSDSPAGSSADIEVKPKQKRAGRGRARR